MRRYFLALAAIVVAFAGMSCDWQSPEAAQFDAELPRISLNLSVREDGTATPLWASGIAIAIGDSAANALVSDKLPLAPQADAWLQVLNDALPLVEVRAAELAGLFDVPPMDAVVVAGNRGSSDGFGWVPNHIGINVQAFADTYGSPEQGATDRMVRIVAHEYLHLLTYASYPHHRELRQTPVDRALWTMFFEGIGDYVSMSSRWLPDEQGNYSPTAADTLGELEPVFVARLEKLVTADEVLEKDLRAGIAMGKFDKKWGSLPVALWLHSEVTRCGAADTLRTVFRLERDSVLPLALRYAAPALRPRIKALRDKVGRTQSKIGDAAGGCLASQH